MLTIDSRKTNNWQSTVYIRPQKSVVVGCPSALRRQVFL